MISNELSGLGLPPVDQIGLVVRDLDKAIAQYDALFGPFTLLDGRIDGAINRGQTEDLVLKVAIGHTGDMEFELIEWVEGNSPHKEFLDSGREGLHHIRFRVDDCDEAIERVKAIGYEVCWYKRMSDDIAFAYLERENDPLIIEFLEMTAPYQTID